MTKRWLCLMALIVAIGSGLVAVPSHAQTETPECSDGIDNDGDGAIDAYDDDCNSAEDTEASDCSDGIDNDGDGFVDHPEDDGCEWPEDRSEDTPHGFHVTSTLRFYGSTGTFRGSLAAYNTDRCEAARLIVLKKIRPGRNRVIARTFTDRRGDWHFRTGRADGRYYAVILEDYVVTGGGYYYCSPDRSVTIRVRP